MNGIDVISPRELGSILEAERELVLRTQENYRGLKQRFLDLQDQFMVIKQENQELKSRQVNSERLQKNFQELERKSKELIHQLEEESKEREIKNELFRATTLTDLERVFQMELREQERRFEGLLNEKEFIGERCKKLEDQIRNEKAERNRIEMETRSREMKLKEHFSSETIRITREINEQRPSCSHDPDLLEGYRCEITELEKKYAELDSIFHSTKRQFEHDLESRDRLLHEEQMNRQTEMVEKQRLKEAMRAQNELLLSRDGEIQSLQKKINSILKEHMTKELEALQHDQRVSADFEKLRLEFELKFASMENECKKRNSIIHGLEKSLNEKKSEIDELNQKIEDQNRQLEDFKKTKQRLEKQRQSQDMQIDQSRAEHEMTKIQRNQLEQNVVLLKKQLDTSPESITQIKKLNRMLFEKEESIKALRHHYRELLKRMKQSLINLEKKHRHVQQKLDASILI